MGRMLRFLNARLSLTTKGILRGVEYIEPARSLTMYHRIGRDENEEETWGRSTVTALRLLVTD
jgi:hypothetical protein